MFNNKPVVVFSSNANASNVNPDPILSNVTHVFFEKDANQQTNVKIIAAYTFYGQKKLEYFEFANGLTNIGERCFQSVSNLSKVYMISNTIQSLGVRSFTNAAITGLLSGKKG